MLTCLVTGDGRRRCWCWLHGWGLHRWWQVGVPQGTQSQDGRAYDGAFVKCGVEVVTLFGYEGEGKAKHSTDMTAPIQRLCPFRLIQP